LLNAVAKGFAEDALADRREHEPEVLEEGRLAK
jgi:hypothetical protein